ncbi:MAG: oxidative damage protection protein [Bdellovibrionales bacterium]|nr:oxidative damage protection protein [Bdellovibrionales bacterium]
MSVFPPNFGRFCEDVVVMSNRTVNCIKFKKELPGLEAPPFPGDIGQQIFDNVSAQAWSEWKDGMQIKVLNEYRLNMGDPKDYQKLVDQMLLFLNLKTGDAVEVENAERGMKGH